MLKWKVGLVVYCGLVLYVSSLGSGDLPDTGYKIPDKLIHVIEYALMGTLAWGGFGKGGNGFPWGILVFCICFGIGDESWQGWLDSGRKAEVLDVAADTLGAFMGILLSMVFWKR